MNSATKIKVTTEDITNLSSIPSRPTMTSGDNHKSIEDLALFIANDSPRKEHELYDEARGSRYKSEEWKERIEILEAEIEFGKKQVLLNDYYAQVFDSAFDIRRACNKGE